ncbi:MAG: hypothetical protein HND47_14110 [Chloroflexi bacterium]|nr:hypothetical protein [Chloroflexota bacterium]
MQKRSLTPDEVGTLILLAAILFGGWFRFMPAWLAGFPINDGGLFYTMMNDLQASRFVPPLYTSYNNLNIPLVYPPLAFYIGGFIGSVFNAPAIEIIRWLPALFNTLTIPVFFLLAREITEDKFQSSVAALVFAFIPRMSTWLSAGGGLTRSLGLFFLILTLYFSWKFFVKNETKSIAGIILAGSLTLLSHTEASVYAFSLPILIWLVKSRSLKQALQAGWIVAGVILLAGPWYGWAIHRHGIEPLLSALKTGSQSFGSVLRLVNFDVLTEEPYLDLLGVLGFLGILFLLARRDYFIPLLLAAIHLVQPRSSHTTGNIPLALAAGFFITSELLPLAGRFRHGKQILLSFLVFFVFINFTYLDILLAERHVSPDEQASMKWVRENTPKDASFLVLTGETDPMCASTEEWFPALTERTSILTLQGREWLPADGFFQNFVPRANAQACINAGADCLDEALASSGKDFDYIYISIKPGANPCGTKNAPTSLLYGLPAALRESDDYAISYETTNVVIFKKR